MRKRWIYLNGEAVPADEVTEATQAGYYVMGDIQPYRSMIDGSLITSRSRHREHLRDHNCVEVGNDSSLRQRPKPAVSPPGLKDVIIRVANEKLKEI